MQSEYNIIKMAIISKRREREEKKIGENYSFKYRNHGIRRKFNLYINV
jgi:hypothetical protein